VRSCTGRWTRSRAAIAHTARVIPRAVGAADRVGDRRAAAGESAAWLGDPLASACVRRPFRAGKNGRGVGSRGDKKIAHREKAPDAPGGHRTNAKAGCNAEPRDTEAEAEAQADASTDAKLQDFERFKK
jgi:hypothetical protein